MDGGSGNDQMIGGALADSLAGGADNDGLFGNNGNDTLDGGEGNDRLVGGGGNDLLVGGAGDDMLTAGAGADTLDLGAAPTAPMAGRERPLPVAATDLTSLDLIADESGAADTLELMDVFDALGRAFAASASAGRWPGGSRGSSASFRLRQRRFLPVNATGDSAGAVRASPSRAARAMTVLDVSQVARLTTPLAFLLEGGEGADC